MKLISGFSEYSADGLAHLGDDVSENLPGLPVLGPLKPTAPEIKAGADALRNAMQMKGPDRAQGITAAFNALAKLLTDVAINAPQIPGVTDTELAEIGLPIAKSRTRETNPPDAPQNLRLSHGPMAGEVTGKCDPVTEGNVRIYEAQWTLDPNGADWSEPATFPNSRAFKFSGLTRGKDIWVRARARNTIGPSAWSDPATIMVT